MHESFETPHNSPEPNSKIPSFENLDAVVEADPMREKDAHILKFPRAEAITTVRIVFNDYSGADLIITNMTTLPESQTGKGLGSAAIQKIVAWATTKGMRDIRAVQVQSQSENFWVKNGFEKMENPNPTNDFVFRG